MARINRREQALALEPPAAGASLAAWLRHLDVVTTAEELGVRRKVDEFWRRIKPLPDNFTAAYSTQLETLSELPERLGHLPKLRVYKGNVRLDWKDPANPKYTDHRSVDIRLDSNVDELVRDTALWAASIQHGMGTLGTTIAQPIDESDLRLAVLESAYKRRLARQRKRVTVPGGSHEQAS